MNAAIGNYAGWGKVRALGAEYVFMGNGIRIDAVQERGNRIPLPEVNISLFRGRNPDGINCQGKKNDDCGPKLRPQTVLSCEACYGWAVSPDGGHTQRSPNREENQASRAVGSPSHASREQCAANRHSGQKAPAWSRNVTERHSATLARTTKSDCVCMSMRRFSTMKFSRRENLHDSFSGT